MAPMVPLNKQSKKKQREYNARKRGCWQGINPVTRRPPNPKAYDRNKEKQTFRLLLGEK